MRIDEYGNVILDENTAPTNDDQSSRQGAANLNTTNSPINNYGNISSSNTQPRKHIFVWILVAICAFALFIGLIQSEDKAANQDLVYSNDVGIDGNTITVTGASLEEIAYTYVNGISKMDTTYQYEYCEIMRNFYPDIEDIDRIVLSVNGGIEGYIGIDGVLIDDYWLPLGLSIEVYNPRTSQMYDITTLYAAAFSTVFDVNGATVKNTTYSELRNWDVDEDYRGYTEFRFENNISAYAESYLGDGELILQIYGYEDIEYVDSSPPIMQTSPTPTVCTTSTPTPRPTARPTPTLSPWTYYPNWTLTDDYCTLQRGDSGTQVRKLQEALVNLGYLDGNVDGKYGPKTEAAVADFQNNNQIYGSTGVATTMTQAILYHEDVYSVHQTNPAGYTNPGNHLTWNAETWKDGDGSPYINLWLSNDGDVPITAYILGYYTETASGKRVYGDHWYWYWDCQELLYDWSYETHLPIRHLPDAGKVDKVYVCVEEIYYADGRVYSSYGIPYERECFEYVIE